MMYETRSVAASTPFGSTPDPRVVYPSKTYARALDLLRCGLNRGDAVLTLTGPPGTGKTLLVRALLAEARGVRSAYLPFPPTTVAHLVHSVLAGLGVDPGPTLIRPPTEEVVRADGMLALSQYLSGLPTAGGRALVAIDEAQSLRPESLEALRLACSAEDSQYRTLQIILVGRCELASVLERDVAGLGERRGARATLRPLPASELEGYVRYRLSGAPGYARTQFDSEALRLVAAFSGGNPRRINLLCDRALFLESTSAERIVDATSVDAAVRMLGWSEADLHEARERRVPGPGPWLSPARILARRPPHHRVAGGGRWLAGAVIVGLATTGVAVARRAAAELSPRTEVTAGVARLRPAPGWLTDAEVAGQSDRASPADVPGDLDTHARATDAAAPPATPHGTVTEQGQATARRQQRADSGGYGDRRPAGTERNATRAVGSTIAPSGSSTRTRASGSKPIPLRLADPGAEAAFAIAVRAHKAGSLASAEQGYLRVLDIDPQNASALVNLGLLLAARDDLEAAERRLRAAVNAAPESASAHANLGAVLLRRGLSEAALARFQRALSLDPEQHDARVNRAVTLKNQGLRAAAEGELLTVLRARPGHALAAYNLALLYHEDGRFNEAAGRYREARDSDNATDVLVAAAAARLAEIEVEPQHR